MMQIVGTNYTTQAIHLRRNPYERVLLVNKISHATLACFVTLVGLFHEYGVFPSLGAGVGVFFFLDYPFRRWGRTASILIQHRTMPSFRIAVPGRYAAPAA